MQKTYGKSLRRYELAVPTRKTILKPVQDIVVRTLGDIHKSRKCCLLHNQIDLFQRRKGNIEKGCA